MDQGPLVTEQIDAGAKFLGQFQKSIPVHAAFWIKDSEEGNWNLYVASKQITDDNFGDAYMEVARISGHIEDPWFDPFQVNVVGVDNPLAKAVLETQKKYSGKIPTRYLGRQVADVEEVYIYPQPLTVGG